MDATSSSSSSTGSIRLHVPTNSLLVPNAAALLGFISGLTNAANLASLQFTAENAHRQPTTVKGWYFYQKTKNYKVIWAGFKGGFINGSKLGAWTAAFVAAQEGLDKVLIGNHLEPHQGRRAACGAVSGASFAFIISKLYKLGRGTTKRSVIGLGLGALAGGLQDLKTELDRRKLDIAV